MCCSIRVQKTCTVLQNIECDLLFCHLAITASQMSVPNGAWVCGFTAVPLLAVKQAIVGLRCSNQQHLVYVRNLGWIKYLERTLESLWGSRYDASLMTVASLTCTVRPVRNRRNLRVFCSNFFPPRSDVRTFTKSLGRVEVNGVRESA